MIKNIKNKYVRRAVWLIAIVPVTIAVGVLGAAWGACETLKEISSAAGRAW